MNKSKQTAYRTTNKSPERLKRLKALNERLHGSLPNFMTQADLRKMRQDRKWDE